MIEFTPEPITIKQVDSGSDLSACFAIRRAVFVDEQGVDPALEFDGSDDHAVSLLATEGDEPVGTARLLRIGDCARLGRVAVLESARGRGIGRMLVRCAMATAVELGAKEIELHSQSSVVEFYERLGFTVEGFEYLEAGIPHRTMRMRLDADTAHES